MEFCIADNRVHIIQDGRVKPCLLLNDEGVDFLKSMRRGRSDEEMASNFIKAVRLREPFYRSPLVVPAKKAAVR